MAKGRPHEQLSPTLFLALEAVAAAHSMTAEEFLTHILRSIVGDKEERRG